MQNLTEADSNHDALEAKTTAELLQGINQEDQTVALAVNKALPQIEKLVDLIHQKMSQGGRLFYIGAGTSGRLGIVDASECPPTFGVPHGLVIGLIAGGDSAIRKAVEKAEDNPEGAWADLKAHHITPNDVVVGIAASGRTPYVVGGLALCQQHQIATGCITNNPGAPVSQHADAPVEVATGPEFVTGSTRMKAGTAQKMVLNMLTTSVMIKLGHVVGNKMVDMQLSNAKLVERGTRMIKAALQIEPTLAKQLLLQQGSVRKAIEYYQQLNPKTAE